MVQIWASGMVFDTVDMKVLTKASHSDDLSVDGWVAWTEYSRDALRAAKSV